MKRKSKLTKRISWFCSIMLVATILSCSKQEAVKPNVTESIVGTAEYDKILTFMAWGLQMPKESIWFDAKTNELYIPNTVVREKFSRVQDEYNNANIYKLEVEGK